MRVTPLDPAARPALERLLTGSRHLFPLGVLMGAGLEPRSDLRWTGAGVGRSAEGLRAALMQLRRQDGDWVVGVPLGDPEGCRAIGASLRGEDPVARFVLGARDAVDALWEGLDHPPVRLWSAHLGFVCRQAAEGHRLSLRLGRMRELSALAAMATAMETEDLGEAPEDPAVLMADLRRKVLERRVWVAELGGDLVFKVDVGLSFDRGALVGGTFVPPEHRGHGHAAAGMRALLDRLLDRVPCVALHVAEANTAAICTYRAAGFRSDAPFRLALPTNQLHSARGER